MHLECGKLLLVHFLSSVSAPVSNDALRLLLLDQSLSSASARFQVHRQWVGATQTFQRPRGLTFGLCWVYVEDLFGHVMA